jgi:hypothetical protein
MDSLIFLGWYCGCIGLFSYMSYNRGYIAGLTKAMDKMYPSYDAVSNAEVPKEPAKKPMGFIH